MYYFRIFKDLAPTSKLMKILTKLNVCVKRLETLFKVNSILKIFQEDGTTLLSLVIIWIKAVRARSDSSLMENKRVKHKNASAYNRLATLEIQRMAHNLLERLLI